MIGVHAKNQAVMVAMSQTFRRLAKLTGFSQRQVLLSEAGSILKRWAGMTKVSTQPQVDRKSRLHAVKSLGYTGSKKVKAIGEVTVNAGFRKDKLPFGHTWIKVRNGAGRKNWLMAKGANFTAPSGTGTFSVYRRSMRGVTSAWLANINNAVAAVQAKVPVSIAKGRRSIGLSRQSVLQIADALDIDLLKVPGRGISAAGIAKAKAAMASTSKAHRNGDGRQGLSGANHDFVDLINRLPYARKIGMDRTLLFVLSGRAKFFEKSYAKGAFDSQRNACRAYPNLFRFRAVV